MKKTWNSKELDIYRLVFIIFIVKLICLPYAQTVDADAVSRVFISVDWLKNPHWIKTGVWAPFHFYIIGCGLYIWNNPVIMPKLINIIFSSFTLIPFYYFTKREFKRNGALIAAFFLAISPILFNNSLQSLSETPYLFFLALTMNLLSLALRKNSFIYALLAGLSITAASGIRYEAWIISAVFGLIILLLHRWKLLTVFVITSLLFPVSWLVTNWLATGNPLFGIQGNYHWTLDVMENNNNLGFESYLRRIWFFPFSWVIATGIPTGYIILKTIWRGYVEKPLNKLNLIYGIPFLIMVLFIQYNAFKGVLLLQHRFIGTLVVLSMPFIAVYFKDLTKQKITQAWIFGASTVLLSFAYNTTGIIPLPRLQDQSGAIINELIKKNTDKGSFLILDFTGWENTYFIALESKLPHDNILITGGTKNSDVPLLEIENKIKGYDHGIILLKRNSVLYAELADTNCKFYQNQGFQGEIFHNEEITLFKFKKKNY